MSKARPIGQGLLALAAVLAAACSPAPPPDPFEPGTTRAQRSAGRVYTVRFEVSCDTCDVNFSVGLERGGGRSTGTWSEVVQVSASPASPLTARLSAAPVPGVDSRERVRILVGGRVVAEAERTGPHREDGVPLTVEALVPSPENGSR